MTLIASIIPQGCAILLGDLLTSSCRQPPRPISIPTIGVLPEKLKFTDENFIVGTAQKLCIVNSRLAVAWAGKKINATDIISKMKDDFSRRRITVKTLFAFFDAQDQNVMKDLQLIMWIRNGSKLESFGVNTTFIDTEEYDHCIFGGSGAGDFISLLSQDIEHDFVQGEPGAHSFAVSHAIQLASSIIAREIWTGETLAQHYGGGMEVVTFSDGRYKKISDILYMYMEYDESIDDRRLQFVPFVYKMDYQKNDLVIRRLEMFLIDKRNNKLTVKSYETHVIRPLLKEGGNFELDFENLPDLAATYFCCTVLCKPKNGGTFIRSMAQYSPKRENPVKIIRSKNGFLVGLDSQFFRSLFESVKRGLGANAGME